MKTASIFEAKTNLSKLIQAIQTQQEPSIIIVKSGKPVARLVPYDPPVTSRIGIAKNVLPKMKSLDEFNSIDADITKDFLGNGGLL